MSGPSPSALPLPLAWVGAQELVTTLVALLVLLLVVALVARAGGRGAD